MKHANDLTYQASPASLTALPEVTLASSVKNHIGHLRAKQMQKLTILHAHDQQQSKMIVKPVIKTAGSKILKNTSK